MDEIEARAPTMKAKIKVTLKTGVLDPQGKAIEGALGSMGFGGVNGVRQGKYFEIELAETDKAKAEAAVKAMCDKLIANTVIENYVIELG
jgi:phosphoribosylformylglycinamidine synthase subunit PurS